MCFIESPSGTGTWIGLAVTTGTGTGTGTGALRCCVVDVVDGFAAAAFADTTVVAGDT
jgi:hypothetical protein